MPSLPPISPPPPLRPPRTAAPPPPLLLSLLLVSLTSTAIAAQPGTCSPANFHPRPCPPFSAASPPPFPFSGAAGCGHPSFQIHCSSPHSLISINNLSFSLLQFQRTSSSLLLSPIPAAPSAAHTCPSAALPRRPINFSGTPFKLSDASCSRLSLLKPCSLPSSLPNCTLCPWHCTLIKTPAKLIHGCGSASSRRPISDQGCQSDVLDYLRRFLVLGIEVEFDESQDPFFSDCRQCKLKNGVCGFNSSVPEKPFLCFLRRPELELTPSPPWIHRRVKVLSSIIVLLSLLCFLVLAFLHLRNKTPPEDPTAQILRRHRPANLLPPVFTYEELASSTNRFDPKRKLGDGGFGSVYLGQHPDGRFVAVKQLHRPAAATLAGDRAFVTKSFCNEILILSSINHPNLVKLHGYCSDPRGLLLVYDYLPNGTLAEHLHGRRSLYRNGALTWPVRVDIALQIAMAVEYLHFSVNPTIVHRDITTSNIFVEKDMRVKLGDFGLSRLLAAPEKEEDEGSGFVWTGPQGTPGYLDPDYYRSFRLTEKSDVYSYGVVLMELVTGMKAVDRRREGREVGLVEMVVGRIQMGLLGEVVDPVLAAVEDGVVVKEGVGAVAELAFRCVAAEKESRPDSREVAAEMRRIWNVTRGVKGPNSNVVVVPES